MALVVRAVVVVAIALSGLVACGGAPAQIVDYSPLRGSRDISTLTPVHITFDHAVDQASVESRLHLVPAAAGHVKWIDGRSLEYDHDKLQTSTTYEVVLEAGYSDITGNVYSLRHHWSFTTEAAPAFTGSTPSGGDADIDPADFISVSFTRPMIDSSLRSAIIFTPDIPFDVRADPTDAKRVIVAPDSLLQANTAYEMLITQSAEDVDGNQLDHVRSITFTTGAVRPLRHWVAFAAENPTGTSGGLWIVNESGFPRQLLGTNAVKAYSWSPDGARLIYETADGWFSFAPGQGTQALGFTSATWAAALAPGLGYVYLDSVGTLFRAPQSGADYVIGIDVKSVAVNPAGERLAFAQQQPDGTSRVWGYDVGLRSRYALASDTGTLSDLSWAPAGNRIAYLRAEAGTTTLRVRSLAGSAAVASVVSGDLSQATWLRDSDHVVLAANIATGSGVVSKAFVINVASPPSELTIALALPAGDQTIIDVSDPVPSPDGHQIAFLSDDQIWLMNADGTRPIALTRFDPESFPYSCLMPAWTRL